jgi:hypothetical protein
MGKAQGEMYTFGTIYLTRVGHGMQVSLKNRPLKGLYHCNVYVHYRVYHPLIIFSCQPFYLDVMDCEQLKRGMEWQSSQYYQRTGK